MPYSRKIFFAIFLAAGALFISLVVVEGFFRAFLPQNLVAPFFKVDSLGLYIHHPSIETSQTIGSTRIPIFINEKGLRDKRPVGEKDQQEIRVLCLGDSFTFGWGVREEESFVSLLEKEAQAQFKGKKIRFLNAGHGGYGTQNILAYLESYGLSLKPDFVLWFIGGAEVETNGTVALYQEKEGSLKRVAFSSSVLSHVKSGLTSNRLYIWLCGHSHLLQWSRGIVTRGFMAHQDKSNAAILSSVFASEKPSHPLHSPTRTFFQRSKEILEAKGIPFMLMPVGDPLAETGHFLETSKRWFQKSGFQYLDLSRQLAEFKKDAANYIRNDNHYSPQGHERFTRLVWPSVASFLSRRPFSFAAEAEARADLSSLE
jgi:hypothetical protein